MKRLIVTLLIVIMVFPMITNAKVVKPPNGFYPHMGVVTSAKKVRKNYFRITFRDAEGRKWAWYDDNTDRYQRGDFVAVIMYDNGTKSVYDDIIVNARYVGHNGLF